MEFLMVLLLIPVVFIVAVLIAALPLYFTLKFFPVENNTFVQALIVTVLAWLVSLAVGIVLGIVGLVIPVLPHLLGTVAPLAVYVVLIQKFYHLNLVEALIVSVVQFVVTVLMVLALVVGVAVPLGLGAAFLAG